MRLQSAFATTVLALKLQAARSLSLVQLRASKAAGGGEEGALVAKDGVIPVDLGSHHMAWSLCTSTYHSNLGGQGPDGGEASLRYYNVTSFAGGGGLDLVITTDGIYLPTNASNNGLNFGDHGCFGSVNIAGSKEGTNSVDLLFSFYRTNTDVPARPEHVYFTLYDVDQGANATESMTLYNETNRVFLDTDTELLQSGDLATGLTFTASTFGTGADNPSTPLNLTKQQMGRAITAEYIGLEQFKLTFSVSGGKGGRNFLFAGISRDDVEPTPAPTDVADEQCQDCIVWGDPHVITFDVDQKRKAHHPLREAFFRTRGWKADEVSIYDEGTFWLVRSRDVQIQARYWKNKTHPEFTNLGALAVGGPFLDGNVLVVRTLDGHVTWNQEKILDALPSEFSNSYVHARYSKSAEIVKDGRKGAGIELDLPGGVSLMVNRWKHSLAARIRMCGAKKSFQEGQCGNRNGLVEDDTEAAILARSGQRLSKEQSIFPQLLSDAQPWVPGAQGH